MTASSGHDIDRRQEALWRRRTWIFFALTLAFVALDIALSRPANMPASSAFSAGMALWLFQTLPLWLFFPALRRHHVRGLSWFGYILLFYLIFAINKGVTPPLWSAALVSVSTLGLFFANAWWVRALKKARRNG